MQLLLIPFVGNFNYTDSLESIPGLFKRNAYSPLISLQSESPITFYIIRLCIILADILYCVHLPVLSNNLEKHCGGIHGGGSLSFCVAFFRYLRPNS
jgi:hypothetical protein